MSDLTGAGARGGSALDGGFTLIESLTASAILLIIAVAVVTTLVTTGGWYAKARMRTEANAVANEVMSLILSRNADQIVYAADSVTWPTGIHKTMTKPTAYGDFSIDTSLAATVDPATGLPMMQVIVTANPVGQTLDPAVSVIRFASGWQQQSAATKQFMVPVQVQLSLVGGAIPSSMRGVRVQLLDATTMAEYRYAVSNDSGLANFGDVPEGQYFLTCDPRFGTSIRPKNFPTRVYPTHGGSATQEVKAVVTYPLDVVNYPNKAILRVGAYRTTGWTNPQPAGGGAYYWTEPDRPYQPVSGLTVYARPVLNGTASGSGTLGYGSTYPDEKQLLLARRGVDYYSGLVNAYGVACIEVDWTTLPGQTWDVWCYTNVNGTQVKHELTDNESGSWTTQLDRIDLPSNGNYSAAPQWERLTGDPVAGP